MHSLCKHYTLSAGQAVVAVRVSYSAVQTAAAARARAAAAQAEARRPDLVAALARHPVVADPARPAPLAAAALAAACLEG